jgi:hypothetical protein
LLPADAPEPNVTVPDDFAVVQEVDPQAFIHIVDGEGRAYGLVPAGHMPIHELDSGFEFVKLKVIL